MVQGHPFLPARGPRVGRSLAGAAVGITMLAGALWMSVQPAMPETHMHTEE
jgi:hypothetical protein